MSNKKGDRKLTHKEKASIKFLEAGDPPFMREIKAKLGYKEPCTVKDKFADPTKEEEDQGLEDRDDIRNMKEEERPQIVVLNEKTDVSKEQLEWEIEQHQQVEDTRPYRHLVNTYLKEVTEKRCQKLAHSLPIGEKKVEDKPGDDRESEVEDAELLEEEKSQAKKKIEEGRITFKKPEKRASKDGKEPEADVKKPRSDSATLKKLQSCKLLSFGDEEEEE